MPTPTFHSNNILMEPEPALALAQTKYPFRISNKSTTNRLGIRIRMDLGVGHGHDLGCYCDGWWDQKLFSFGQERSFLRYK